MKLVIAISGASGACYAQELLFALKQTAHSVEVVATANARMVWWDELGSSLDTCGFPVHSPKNFKAPFASGSALYDKMVIIPCSMGTLGRIAQGISNDLISRAADVFLKERRPLIVVPRETPFNLIHLENMRRLVLAGATILPAVPSFYSKPQTVREVVCTVVARVLDHLGITDHALALRYEGKLREE